MENRDIKAELLTYSVVILFLIIAITARFFAITHQLTLDWSAHVKVIDAYFHTVSRSHIFLVQFVSIFCIAGLVPFLAKKEMKIFTFTFILFSLVSILRYAYPLFVVSLLGDLLVLIVIALVARSSQVPKIGLALSIPISILLVPKGLWMMGFAMLRS